MAIWKKPYYNKTISIPMSKENNIAVQVNTKKLQIATFAAGCFWGFSNNKEFHTKAKP